MATPPPDVIEQSPRTASPISPASPTTGEVPLEQAPKLKGRHKLLQNLQRMSSSPSLTRRGRSASTGYRRDAKASLSCVSLSPNAYTPCLGNGSFSQLYGGLNGPSSAGSPAENRPDSPRIRLVGRNSSASVQQSKSVPLPVDLRPVSRGLSPDCASIGNGTAARPSLTQQKTIDFWGDMPHEIRMKIFLYLSPKEIVRCSHVSKAWHKMCYDGQLWSNIDTPEYYTDIPSDVLVKLIVSGGPFVRNLNLRGCSQLPEKWSSEGERISAVCRNVVNLCVEGCHIDRKSMHSFFLRNSHLEHISMPGLSSVTNSAMNIIAQSCPCLETLNVSWCSNVDTSGLKKIVQSCSRLRDLRVAEVSGFEDEEFMLELFEKNTLERLVLSYTDVTDQALKAFALGVEPEIDILTGRPIVPPRRLKHLDLYQCVELTDDGVKNLAYTVPNLEYLQLSKCAELSDDSIIPVIRNTPQLTHLELEDLESLTNETLVELAKSPCARRLEHLNISFCENLGDIGMLQVFKNCKNIRFAALDNTRVSDLSLMEASSQVRKRGYNDERPPRIGVRLVIYDCANITWAGVKEVLSSNAYVPRNRKGTSTEAGSRSNSPANTSTTKLPTSSTSSPVASYPNEIIKLKCCHPWQMTVEEHTKRVLRGDLAAASRLDRKWADYMMATEEGGILGMGVRRRRRRLRDAEQRWNADEEEADDAGGVPAFGGGRRRAQSGGACVVM